MADPERWHRMRRRAPAWLASFVVHLVVLAVLGMATWMVVEAREPDRPLMLVEQKIPADDGGRGAESPGASGGAGTDRFPASRQDTALAPAAIPRPKPLELSAEALRTNVSVPKELVDAARPGRALAEALAGASVGPGGAVGPGGIDGGFPEVIRDIRKKGLDVVLILDATDSMTPYIEQAKERLRQVVRVITHLVPDSAFGVVAYKDYGDDYGRDAVRFLKITADHRSVRAFIDEITAGGGADPPEPVNEALAVAVDRKRMGWRAGRERVIILVGDSSIHPSGRKRAFQCARQFSRTLRGTINVIDVGGAGDQDNRRRTVQPDLARIAREGKGSAFLLTDRDAFWRHLIVSVFGQRYERDVSTIIERLVNEEENGGSPESAPAGDPSGSVPGVPPDASSCGRGASARRAAGILREGLGSRAGWTIS